MNPRRKLQEMNRFLQGQSGPRARRPTAASKALWDLWAQVLRSLNISADRLNTAIDRYIQAINALNEKQTEAGKIKPPYKGNILPALLGQSALTFKSWLRALHIIGIIRIEISVKVITHTHQEVVVGTAIDLGAIKHEEATDT